jgi:hypothetical protein
MELRTQAVPQTWRYSSDKRTNGECSTAESSTQRLGYMLKFSTTERDRPASSTDSPVKAEVPCKWSTR